MGRVRDAIRALRGMETRSYAELSIAAQLSRAQGLKTDATVTAAAQTAAGMYARGLAAAKIGPDIPEARAVTRRFLHEAGRAMVLQGEGVWSIEVMGGELKLRRAGGFDIQGDPDPATWIYRLLLTGPNRTLIRFEPSEGVVHPRWNEPTDQPWRGRSPFETSGMSSRLSGGIESTLAAEAEGGSAYLVPAPIGGVDTEESNKLTAEIKGSDGKPVAVPTGAGTGWEDGGGADRASMTDWKQRRIGSEPPQALVQLREDVSHDLLAAAGIPVDLARPGATTTAAREGFRRFLHSSLAPLAEMLLEELREKLDPRLTLNLETIHAADVQGRARAFQSMVGGGMPTDRAAALSGLLEPE